MISLVQVSQMISDRCDRSRVLADIEAESLARNTMLTITGLLIASPEHFVHLLEGPALHVTAVAARIAADPRHTGLRVIREAEIARASFPVWQMVRLDSTSFGQGNITALLAAVHAGGDAAVLRRLDRLIAEVATGLTR